MFQFSDLGLVGAAIGAGIVTLAAGLGISRLAVASVESMARQPEMKGPINGAMILTAALIEGVALFACVICLLISFSAVQEIEKEEVKAPEKAAQTEEPGTAAKTTCLPCTTEKKGETTPKEQSTSPQEPSKTEDTDKKEGQ